MTDSFNKTDRALLVRLEERIKGIQDKLSELEERVDWERDDSKDKYVHKKDFYLVQRAVYAAIGFILVAFCTALVTMVFKSGVFG